MPFHLVLSPLVGAIAAGCPTIIKASCQAISTTNPQPSEKASECAKLLASLFPQYLDPDGFTVVNGGPEVATYLLQKRWGHGKLNTLWGRAHTHSSVYGL
jgi:aldehyde dehydrogenase (NAD+)